MLALLLAALFAQVPFARVREARPDDWLTYSGNYQGHRHSALREIDTSNSSHILALPLLMLGIPLADNSRNAAPFDHFANRQQSHGHGQKS